jgi:hypothetical protein
VRPRSRLLLAAILVGGSIAVTAIPSEATLENQVFTSRPHRLKLSVPRGWRASDQSSYPGMLLWMRRSKPPGLMLLTSEILDDEAYCSWPAECRQQSDVLAAQYACALTAKLERAGFKIGPVQTGPREGELPSVWFEYDDGKKWLRQAVATFDAHAHTLILSAASAQQRGSHSRAFDQALRSLHSLPVEEVEVVPVVFDAAPAAPAGDAGSGNGSGTGTGTGTGTGSGSGSPDASTDDGGVDGVSGADPGLGSGSSAGSGAGSGSGSGSGSNIAAVEHRDTVHGRLTKRCPKEPPR